MTRLITTVFGDEKLFSIVDVPGALPASAEVRTPVTEGSRTVPDEFRLGTGAPLAEIGTFRGKGEPPRPLFGLSREELETVVAGLGQPGYRARQLQEALYRQWVTGLDEVSTLPKALRASLDEAGYVVGLPEIVETFRSVDGTERYLIAGLDGQTVETVWMPGGDGGEAADLDTLAEEELEASDVPDLVVPGGDVLLSETGSEAGSEASPRPSHNSSLRWNTKDLRSHEAASGQSSTRERPLQRRATICVSSQIGCAVNCQFCLTAKLGIIRNLSAGEIAGQVVAVLKRQGVHLGRDRINLVFMGMGEPFLNYDAFLAAMHLLTDSVGLAASRMTVSTSGIVPGILRFAQEPVRCKLAISLNAPNDAVREQIMPITRKWSIEAVLDAVRTIPLGPRERITFEYVLLGGVNDKLEHADEVVRLVRGADFACYVNLIVWNPGPDTPYAQPQQTTVDAFQHRLISQGVTAYIRRPRGRDIYAACGQLKRTTS